MGNVEKYLRTKGMNKVDEWDEVYIEAVIDLLKDITERITEFFPGSLSEFDSGHRAAYQFTVDRLREQYPAMHNTFFDPDFECDWQTLNRELTSFCSEMVQLKEKYDQIQPKFDYEKGYAFGLFCVVDMTEIRKEYISDMIYEDDD